ncbi:hypothetical protein PBY51_008287 [Eleginops maclovinus]|nr:hypothetical protein PBY51_008287 [Eleginops maclovinus]
MEVWDRREHLNVSPHFLPAGTEEDAQVSEEAEDHFSTKMAQRTFPESGQDGRSVLGMLSVQVERDPKTGATVVRSVAPLSSPSGATTTVFDDGRKSIHAVGGSGSQPSSEELGQILSVVDGVGMRVLLDEVTVTPDEVKTESEDAVKAPKGKLLSVFSRQNEDETLLDASRSYESDLKTQECSGSKRLVQDIPGEVNNVEDLSLEEGPVTLVFMGYSDQGQEDDEGPITVERVMITEEGEETVIGPQTPPKESKEFQDILLEGNGAKVQGEEADKGLHNSSSPSEAEGGGTPKRKSCQCCSVM